MRVKWGIIGCGSVAENKGGPALYQAENSELVAVMRRDVNKARDFAERHGAKRYYVDVKELIEDEEVNAVYVATPVYLHSEQTIMAAESGKHVLCEKPMAMNVEECRRMMEACKSNGVLLAVAYYRRFYPCVMKAKELLASKAIGDVMLARVNLTGYYNPKYDTQWRTKPELSGGGVLMDVGSHRIDVLIYLLGDVESVTGYAETLHASYAVDDSAVLAFRFESGVHAIANFNWNIGFGADDLEFYGTEGRLYIDLGSGDMELRRGNERREWHLPPPRPTHIGIVQDFVECIATGNKPVCSGEEGMKTNEVMEAIYETKYHRGKSS